MDHAYLIMDLGSWTMHIGSFGCKISVICPHVATPLVVWCHGTSRRPRGSVLLLAMSLDLVRMVLQGVAQSSSAASDASAATGSDDERTSRVGGIAIDDQASIMKMDGFTCKHMTSMVNICSAHA